MNPSAQNTYAQILPDATMMAHRELLSITIYGVLQCKTDAITTFAGPYPKRIGLTISPCEGGYHDRWPALPPHPRHEPEVRGADADLLRKGNAVGLIVRTFKIPVAGSEYERTLYTKARDPCDALAKKMPSQDTLFTLAQ